MAHLAERRGGDSAVAADDGARRRGDRARYLLACTRRSRRWIARTCDQREGRVAGTRRAAFAGRRLTWLRRCRHDQAPDFQRLQLLRLEADAEAVLGDAHDLAGERMQPGQVQQYLATHREPGHQSDPGTGFADVEDPAFVDAARYLDARQPVDIVTRIFPHVGA